MGTLLDLIILDTRHYDRSITGKYCFLTDLRYVLEY
jgi:hypothetical protein